jgi:hypothetical protein
MSMEIGALTFGEVTADPRTGELPQLEPVCTTR